MAVQFEEQQEILIVTVPRRVDVTNTLELMMPIQKQIDGGRHRLILDLSGTEAIDSTALGALVQIFKLLTASGGAMILVGIQDAVRRVFALTRLDTVFVQSATRDEAVLRLQNKR